MTAITTSITFNVPLANTPEDNKTEITKTKILVKDCSAFGNPNDECEGWNFNHCPNDNDYCQPFIVGDMIYNQFRYDSRLYNIGNIEFINIQTGVNFYDSDSVQFQIGADEINNTYLNSIIDTSHSSFSGVDCWYIKITLTPKQGEGDLLFTFEPYCLVKCNENTIVIEGLYPSGYDCFGNYYGNLSGFLGGASIYKPHYRIRGVIENDGFDFEKTANNNKVVKSTQTERFILMTKPLPYYVAKQIAICFNSKLTTIDGVNYSGTIKLNKNFDEGQMWIIRENISVVCDEINFTCD